MVRRRPFLASLLVTLIGLGLATALFGREIRQRVVLETFLHARTAHEPTFRQIIESMASPASFLNRCWATRNLTHRRLVLDFIQHQPNQPPPWLDEVAGLPVAGATDVDMSIRELSLAVIAARQKPKLLSLAQAQLRDVDPEVRLLGLQYLGRTGTRDQVRSLIPLLDDPDLRVQASCEVILKKLTGVDFGVRASHSISRDDPSATTGDAANFANISRGIAERKNWWRLHQAEFPPTESVTSETSRDFGRASNFSLLDASGRPVQLSDFRGKCVLLNFWTTWCPACITEMPALTELQQRHPNDLVILGVSLDGIPDEHGLDHPGGEESVRTNDDDAEPAPASAADQAKIRAHLTRIIQDRKLNYRILHDPTGEIGSRFNGGELPTNVLLDVDGQVRRRFIGARPLPALEAMLAELAPK